MLQLNNLKKVVKLFVFPTCCPHGLTFMLHCPKMRYPCILFSLSLAELFFMSVYWGLTTTENNSAYASKSS